MAPNGFGKGKEYQEARITKNPKESTTISGAGGEFEIPTGNQFHGDNKGKIARDHVNQFLEGEVITDHLPIQDDELSPKLGHVSKSANQTVLDETRSL